jgi:uncharacterized membrane-anchored protein
MNAQVRLVLLVVLGVAQLAAAGWSIARYESVRAWGTLYRIPIAPVDPADAFRGRYVAVRPAIAFSWADQAGATDEALAEATRELLAGIERYTTKGYVVLARDDQGFAKAVQVVATRPSGADYLEIAHASRRNIVANADVGYTLSFAFDRYYINEASAPLAEQRYVEMMRRNPQTRAWVEVRIRKGVAVVTGLSLDGVPIEQLAVS